MPSTPGWLSPAGGWSSSDRLARTARVSTAAAARLQGGDRFLARHLLAGDAGRPMIGELLAGVAKAS
jgi:hypothetical protein